MSKSRNDGMVSAEEWALTEVHQASSYACGKCGQGLPSPEAVYDHLDNEECPTDDDE